MARQNDLLMTLLHEMRSEIKEMRGEIAQATGFIRGAKWAFAVLFGVISFGAAKLGLGSFVIRH